MKTSPLKTQMSRYKKITLEDLSQRSGLSKTTISRVLSGKSHEFRINADTTRLVIDTAVEMNYRPELVARLLQSRQRYTIGLVVPNLSNPYYASLAETVAQEAQRQNLIVALFDSQNNPSIEDAAILKMRAMKTAGILLVPSGTDARPLEKVASLIPIVQLDRYISGSHLPYVSSNNFKGAYEAVTMLLQYGHRNITVVQGDTTSITSSERVRGCRQAVSDFGEPCVLDVRGNDFSSRNGYLETLLALGREDRPTAIFTLSNSILYGAVRALHEKGLTWPNDISLVSFDTSNVVELMQPSITRVEQPVLSMAVAALKMLTNKIFTDQQSTSGLLLTPTLVKRDSVGFVTVSPSKGAVVSHEDIVPAAPEKTVS